MPIKRSNEFLALELFLKTEGVLGIRVKHRSIALLMPKKETKAAPTRVSPYFLRTSARTTVTVTAPASEAVVDGVSHRPPPKSTPKAKKIAVTRAEAAVQLDDNSDEDIAYIKDDGRDWVTLAESGLEASPAVQQSHPLPFVASLSPVGLIQEKLKRNPWMLLSATIFLNKTRGDQAKPVMWDFFNMFPTPEKCCAASVSEVSEVIYTLGMQKQRASRLIQFSKAYVENPRFDNPMALPGIGKYGDDSWRLFCGPTDDHWVSGNVVTDKELIKYVRWRRQTRKLGAPGGSAMSESAVVASAETTTVDCVTPKTETAGLDEMMDV
ncbi:Methyl-CpG-binding domain protein 4 [Irineochytrium annulatum]|nr:Methyl-CpG-binding domain protein 4 [Irineochytrium annulatum]